MYIINSCLIRKQQSSIGLYWCCLKDVAQLNVWDCQFYKCKIFSRNVIIGILYANRFSFYILLKIYMVWIRCSILWINYFPGLFLEYCIVFYIYMYKYICHINCFILVSHEYYDSFEVVSSNPAHGVVYSIQHYVITFVSDLWQVGGFLGVLRLPPPIKLTSTILLKYCWKWG